MILIKDTFLEKKSDKFNRCTSSQSLDLKGQKERELKPGDGLFSVPNMFVGNACKNVECSTGVLF